LEKLEKISSKIINSIIEMKDSILQEVNFSAELLQNSATLSLTPEMSGINTAQASDEVIIFFHIFWNIKNHKYLNKLNLKL